MGFEQNLKDEEKVGTLSGWFVVTLKSFFHILILLKSKECILLSWSLNNFLTRELHQSFPHTSENCISLGLARQKEMRGTAEAFLPFRLFDFRILA